MSAKWKRKKKARPSITAQPSRPSIVGSSHWALTGALVASAAFGGLTTPVFAQNQAEPVNVQAATRRFAIPAGSLKGALEAFSQTTGLAVTDPKNAVGELNSSGLSGTFSDEEALRALLEGRGLAYRFTSARAVRIELARMTSGLDSVATLDEIAVRGTRPTMSSPKYAADLVDIPQSVTVIPKEVMQSQGATTLRDVVRNIPGLTVNAGEGGATPGDNFNLRGFSARNDVFVDGLRAPGGYTRDVYNIEQVEVTKGPASAYIGRGSTGGAINLVTKTPHLGRRYSVTAGLGSASYEQASVDLNQPLDRLGFGDVAVRLNANLQDAGVAGLPVVERSSWGVAPSLAIGLGSATQFIVEHSHTEQDNMPAYGVQSNNLNEAPPVETRRFFGLRSLDFEKVNVDRGSARVQHQFDESLTLRNQFSWGSEQVHRIVTYTNLTGARNAPSHVTDDAMLFNQTTLAKTFVAGQTRHAVTAGVEFGRDDSYFSRYTLTGALPTTDASNPDPNQQFTGAITEGPARRDMTATTIGAYVFETAQLGQRFEVSAGLRWDRFNPTYRDTAGVELLPHTTSEAVSWRGGLVYKPADNGSVYAAYGTSFNPSGEGLAYDATGTNGLDPEKNRSMELGTKWELFRDRMLVSAAVFRTEKTNARMTDPNDPLGQTIILAGKQRAEGVELGASGRVMSEWMVFAGYMFLETDVSQGNATQIDRPLPNNPKHSLSLWTTYRLPWEIEIGGGARHMSRRITSATASVPPYWAFDAEAAYPLGSRMLLRLNLMNLTDAKYYDNGRFWVPAAGRAVRLTTSFTY